MRIPISTDQPRYVDSSAFLIALTLLCVTAMSSTTISPIMLGQYVDSAGLTERLAGLVAASEASGYVLAQALLAAVAHRWSRRGLALSSMVFTLAGNIATLWVAGFLPLAGARLVTGFGAGVALATMGASIAARKEPQRGYSVVTLFALLYAVLLLAVSGAVAQRFGLRGLIAIVLVLNGVGLIACLWIPSRIDAPPSLPDAPGAAPAPHTRPRDIMRLCATLLLLYIAHNALWSYQERMGVALGLARSAVGVILAISVGGGIVGAAVAAFAGMRKGLAAPQLLSMAALIVSAVLVANVRSAAIFAISATLIKAAWFFGLPYLQAALARLDTTGRAVVAGGSLQTLGTMLGTAAAAYVVPYGRGYVGVFAAVIYLICIPLCLSALRRIDRAAVPRMPPSETPSLGEKT
ncbi:MAG: MFS transporter [Steroidobacteraceae bacterium]